MPQIYLSSDFIISTEELVGGWWWWWSIYMGLETNSTDELTAISLSVLTLATMLKWFSA